LQNNQDIEGVDLFGWIISEIKQNTAMPVPAMVAKPPEIRQILLQNHAELVWQ
jgi:hypothetical protein